MVAKSYQTLEIIQEPFSENGRLYVKVKTKKGIIKKVRWYSESEYAKMYPDENPQEKRFRSQKDVLGFEKGYITVFKGDNLPPKEWFREHGARYTRFWGWFIPSELDVPTDIPFDVDIVRLDWDVVGDGDKLKPDDQVIAALDSIIYDEHPSQFQGVIGDRLTRTLVVDKAITLNGYFGLSTMHIMRDAQDNVYIWTTAAKTWGVGSTHTLVGTVKDHKVYHNTKQTVLTRCREIIKD